MIYDICYMIYDMNTDFASGFLQVIIPLNYKWWCRKWLPSIYNTSTLQMVIALINGFLQFIASVYYQWWFRQWLPSIYSISRWAKNANHDGQQPGAQPGTQQFIVSLNYKWWFRKWRPSVYIISRWAKNANHDEQQPGKQPGRQRGAQPPGPPVGSLWETLLIAIRTL